MMTSPSSLPRVAQCKPSRPRREQITPTMTCDAAFRIAACNCLQDVTANQAPACAGNGDAIHQTRIALTRLRALVSFFSPMASDPKWIHLKSELKWLNSYLGAARDMDVLMSRLKTSKNPHPEDTPEAGARHRHWIGCHQRVTRALKSQRHERLTQNLWHWIEGGGRTTTGGRHRTEAIAVYSTRRLSRWRRKLLKKSRRLESMNTDKIHQLRIATKKLRYAMEFFGSLVSPQHPARQKAMLKHLRKAQESLGSLNDAERIRSLTTSFMSLRRPAGHRNPNRIEASDDEKCTKRLLHAAARAYRKMEEANPF